MASKLEYFHLATLNVQGLRYSQKRLRLLQWIEQQNVNIILLQETHFTLDIVSKVNSDFENMYTHHSFGSNHSKGCSILINKKT